MLFSGSGLTALPSVKAASSLSTMYLAVEGMTCKACPTRVERALSKVPGVQSALALFPEGLASVTFAPAKASEKGLLQAMKQAGFQTKMAQMSLAVSGMSCQACPPKVQAALQKVKGVARATIFMKEGLGVVVYDPSEAESHGLIKAVNQAGFRASYPRFPGVMLAVKGMTCGNCPPKVEAALKRLNGVKKIVVSLESGEALVSYNPARTGIGEVVEAIEKPGFRVSLPTATARQAAPAQVGNPRAGCCL
jgi:copper ion binding protein